MNGRDLRWLALAAMLSLAACGGSDAAPDDAGDSTQDPDAAQVDPQAGPPPTTDVSGTPPPEPEPQGKGPTPIVRSKADGPSRPSPAGQRYTDCMAKAGEAGEGERALLEASCASLPDAPKQN